MANKIKFPAKSVVINYSNSCNCQAGHIIKLIGIHETRLCAKCNAIQSAKTLSKEDYANALQTSFL